MISGYRCPLRRDLLKFHGPAKALRLAHIFGVEKRRDSIWSRLLGDLP
ncbi:MAG: hypothetical protein WDA20_13990 [Desulfuromonadales bacterium]